MFVKHSIALARPWALRQLAAACFCGVTRHKKRRRLSLLRGCEEPNPCEELAIPMMIRSLQISQPTDP